MRALIIFFFFILCFSIDLFAQEFEVSDITSNKFSIDPFTEDIYIKELWSGDIYVTNLKTGITGLSRFPTLPAFANKTHLAAYVDNKRVYFYEFDRDSTYEFIDSIKPSTIITYSKILFSPNDSAIIINESYYDLSDKKKYSLNEAIFNVDILNYHGTWSTDSTLIRSDSDGNIFQHFIKSERLDTLITVVADLQRHAELIDYEYNEILNTLSYSIFNEEGYAELRFYDLKNKQDTIIFSQTEDLPPPRDTQPFAFTELKWSPNKNRLAFFSLALTVSGAGVLVFDLDSNKTKLLTECNEYGKKYYTCWLNQDTLIYIDTNVDLLMGFDVLSSVTDLERFDFLPETFLVRNYPNPFNNSTLIRFSFPVHGKVKVKIYDVLGAIVKVIDIENVLSGNYEIQWNGKNENGISISSGIYFAQAELTGFNNKIYFQQFKMVLIK